ncbi:hypothetical protein K1719_036644 [Acacia pycnantha]|nr:hypothetical protein K1719_036644 [Acacia pycnantha]
MVCYEEIKKSQYACLTKTSQKHFLFSNQQKLSKMVDMKKLLLNLALLVVLLFSGKVTARPFEDNLPANHRSLTADGARCHNVCNP